MTVLVDTSALHAALDSDDDHHLAARGALTELTGRDELLVTHNYVVVETVALVQRRLGLDAVRALIDHILPAIDVLWIDQATHQEASVRLLGQGTRRVSLVDWVSFTVMRRLGIDVALAFDDHFREQGFRTVPG